jgi:hypothetical protein
LLGKHLFFSPFFPYQAGDKVLWNKHPETSFYTVKEDDCNIEMIHRQCLHVALTLNLPYHRPLDIELLAIAQAVGMVPAADNSFKYQTTLKAGLKGGLKSGPSSFIKKLGIHDPKHKGKGGKVCAAKKVGAHDPNLKGKITKARNIALGNQQWNDSQIQV